MSPSRAIGSTAGLIALGAAAVVGWLLSVRGDGPPPVDLQRAVERAAGGTPPPAPVPAASAAADRPLRETPGETRARAAVADPPAHAPAAPDTVAPFAAPGTVDPVTPDGSGESVRALARAVGARASAGSAVAGEWRVVPGASFVGYRIGEELARVGRSVAVGRTTAVSGTLRFDGRAIAAGEVVADLRALASDDGRRDRALRTHGLETDRFPVARFRLVGPGVVPAAPGAHGAFAARVAGDLEIRGVTRRVAVDLEGQLAGGRVVAVGSTVVALADFAVERPVGFNVLGIDHDATIELELVFDPAAPA